MGKKLDVGCGRRPKEGYDVYTDVYEPPWVKENPEMGKKFVLTPAEDLSQFKDKEFDFVWCNHVIEHVQDPNKACAELMRVGKAGMIRFPTIQAEILVGRRDHNWMVFIVNDHRLLFIKKRFKSFYGAPKSTLPNHAGEFVALQQKPFFWRDSFKWTVLL